MTAPLFDTHCHLDDERLNSQLDQALERAKNAGVAGIVSVGCAKAASEIDRALKIALQHSSWIYATVGVHPHDAKNLNDEIISSLRKHGVHSQVVAIGETGLDYHYNHSPHEAQLDSFRKHISLARELKKPLVIHTRNAASDTLRILREENARDVGGIMHCFSEDSSFAKAALEINFVASFSGIVTFKTAQAIQEAARVQPIDALLIETDAPYLAPVPFRGKCNEPAFVAHTADFIAQLRGMSPEMLRQATFENAKHILLSRVGT